MYPTKDELYILAVLSLKKEFLKCCGTLEHDELKWLVSEAFKLTCGFLAQNLEIEPLLINETVLG
jgi:hypothetical protein